MKFYFGACAGGLWRTTSGGLYWDNITDGFLGSSSIGAVALAPSAPERMYIGTGESCVRADVSAGDGVYRSSDAGATWQRIGLEDTRHISRIHVNPTDPDTVFVGALGDVWQPDGHRGVFRSRDGGATWERLLHVSDRAGIADLAMDPSQPNVLFAAMWQVRRRPDRIISGGRDSGLWRSTDGGHSWTELTSRLGLPVGPIGRIGLAVSPAKPGRLWAVVEARGGGLFCSDDNGDTWRKTAEAMALRRRPWYFMHLAAHPGCADTLWG
jgi:photosystem II stability/assembly factor-like uncharacterized protein